MVLLNLINKIKKALYRKTYLSIVVISIVVVSCSINNQHKTFAILFDGYSESKDKELKAEKNALHGKIDSLILPGASTPKDASDQITVNKSKIHEPFLNKECNRCHEMDKMYTVTRGLREPQSETCYQCHQNFGEKFSSLHAPVASGNCTTCHNPHQSTNEKLLKLTDRNLCYNCHNESSVLANRFHEKIEDKNCIECHDPHGGNGIGNIASLKSGVCRNCHKDVLKGYTVLHGPLNEGECNTCHSKHNLTADKNLLRKGKETCFYCHNSEMVLQNTTHKDNKNTDCIKCHNPHGGETRYILRANK